MKANPPQIPRKIPIVFILLLVALILRLMLLGHKTLWADEGAVWYMALGEVEHDAPPVYYYLYNWSITLFGWNEFAGRFPSALFGWLSVIMVYTIAVTFLDRRMASWSAGLAAISAFLVPLSQDMRIYSIVGFEALVALFCFLKILLSEKTHPGWWIALLVVGIIGQNSHCFFVLVLGYFGFVLLLYHGWQNWRRWMPYAAVLILMLLFSSTQLQTAVGVTTHRQHLIASDFSHLLRNAYLVVQSYFAFLFGDVFANKPGGIIYYIRTHPLYSIIAVAMVICWGFVAASALVQFRAGQKRKGREALIFRLLAGMLAGFTLLYVIVDVSSPGHLIFVYVPFLFLIAAGFAGLKGKIRVGLAGLFLVFSVYALLNYYQSPTIARDTGDWRHAGRMLKNQWTEGDGLLILAPRNAYYAIKFYFPDLSGDAYYYPRHDPILLNDEKLMNWWDETTTPRKIETLLGDHRRVWLIDPLGKRQFQEEVHADFMTQLWSCGTHLKLYLITR
jgi:4-amino-4-deoxy-L-arabinose transferase-like glycosyltransferase